MHIPYRGILSQIEIIAFHFTDAMVKSQQLNVQSATQSDFELIKSGGVVIFTNLILVFLDPGFQEPRKLRSELANGQSGTHSLADLRSAIFELLFDVLNAHL